MSKKLGLGIGALLLVAICLCLTAGGGVIVLLRNGVLASTQPVADTGDRFLGYLKAADYGEAYDMLTDERKAVYGSADALESAIIGAGVQPASWSYTSRSYNNTAGKLIGTVQTASGKSAKLEMDLVYLVNHWRISSFRLALD